MPIYLKLMEAQRRIGTIEKDARHQQGYLYQSINEVSNAIREVFSDIGILLLENIDDVTTIFDDRYLVRYTYTFIDPDDGSTHVQTWAGEAIKEMTAKSGNVTQDDKALGKCHSYSLKYFLMRTFLVSAPDDADLDTNEQHARTTHMAKQPTGQQQAKTHPPHALEILKLGNEVYGEDWLHGKPVPVLVKTLRFLFGGDAGEDKVEHLNMDESDRLLKALHKKRDEKAKQAQPDVEGDIPF